MKIQLVSDLHLEHHPDGGRAFVDGLQNAGADVLVMSGDVTNASKLHRLDEAFAAFADRWPDVVFVMGNHESWGGTLKRTTEQVAEIAARRPNIHFLNNEAKDFGGVRFFGGTGWFKDPGIERSMYHRWADYHLIPDAEPLVYQLNDAFERAAIDCGPDVVVSHHMPSPLCVQPKYAGDQYNRFFYSDFDVVGIGAKLWLFGHTHTQIDMDLFGTRAVCNPLGRPGEPGVGEAFQPALILEV